MNEQKVHGSDAIVVLVGFYSGEVKALQARLAASEEALRAVSQNYALLAKERAEMAALLEVPESTNLAEVLCRKKVSAGKLSETLGVPVLLRSED